MDEAKEELGQAIDSLENLATALVNMTMIPDRIHVESLRSGLPDLVVKMKEAFVKVTGENPWENEIDF